MATNRKLRQALLEKLDISQQALSQRVQRKKRQMPMSTEDAAYLIAHESGIKIDRYLASEQVDRVRHLHTVGGQNIAGAATRGQRPRLQDKKIPEIRFPGEFRGSDPILPTSKLNEAVAMAKLYPLLYVLENSMRELTKRVLKSKFGNDWWNTELTSSRLKPVYATAALRMKTEKTKHAWHQRRGAHPIDYVQIEDLESIILGKYIHFKDIISDREWFIQFMKEFKPSRNVICHMNPLDADNARDIQIKVRRWQKMIRNALDKIPE